MKKFCSRSPSLKYSGEIISDDKGDRDRQHQLPRHLSVIETQSHRGRHNLNRNAFVIPPRVCQIRPYSSTKASAALDILKYQLSDRTKQQHLKNVRTNLEYRLQVAKAEKNDGLVHILQDEYRQLEISLFKLLN